MHFNFDEIRDISLSKEWNKRAFIKSLPRQAQPLWLGVCYILRESNLLNYNSMKNSKFLNNREAKRYELKMDGGVAFIDYIVNSRGVVYLTHTEVPKELSGRGVGTYLIEKTLEEIRSQEQTFFPQCPFIKSYVQKNREWVELISQ